MLADSFSSSARAPKSHRAGTHRTVSPAETLARLEPNLRAMGITRVANITGLDVIGLPVVAVTRPGSRSISVAQGKGIDLTAAKVSGIMEAVENFHAERIRAPLLYGSTAEMRDRGPVLDVDLLPRIAGSSLHVGDRMLWIEGHEVMGRRRVLLPFELVHTDYVVPLPAASGAFQISDSGVASGNHPFEATSHAICELVERDAVALWVLSPEDRRSARRIDLATVSDEACGHVLQLFEHAGMGVAVWDITTDIGIPAFFCTIMEAAPSTWRPLAPASGSGCHPSRSVALLRALTEAAQARLTVIAGARDDLGLAKYRQAEDGELLARSLEVFGRAPCASFTQVPTFESDALEDDLTWEMTRLRAAGVSEVAVVDLTLPELGIAVVRVVIPGLEGLVDGPGYCPGPRARAQSRSEEA